jgi:hypothetical protein
LCHIGRSDEVEQNLRYHAPENGQGKGGHALAADRVHLLICY